MAEHVHTYHLQMFHNPDFQFIKYQSIDKIENREGDTVSEQTWEIKSKGKPIQRVRWCIETYFKKEPEILSCVGCSLTRNESYDQIYRNMHIYGYDLDFQTTLDNKRKIVTVEWRRFKHYPINYDCYELIRMTEDTKHSELIICPPKHGVLLRMTATHEDIRESMDSSCIEFSGSKGKWNIKNPKELHTYRVNFKWNEKKV